MKPKTKKLLSPFHYNKDWNAVGFPMTLWNTLLLSPFHYNKDWNKTSGNGEVEQLKGYYPLSIITRIETGQPFLGKWRFVDAIIPFPL